MTATDGTEIFRASAHIPSRTPWDIRRTLAEAAAGIRSMATTVMAYARNRLPFVWMETIARPTASLLFLPGAASGGVLPLRRMHLTLASDGWIDTLTDGNRRIVRYTPAHSKMTNPKARYIVTS